MSPDRKGAAALTAAVLVSALTLSGLSLFGCSNQEPGKQSAPARLAQDRRALAGSPAALASLHRQANKILSGGPRSFKRRLAALRGYPLVINKWASWCGPCRIEFPFFQKIARKYGKRVAFVGIDAKDSSADAHKFLRQFPLSFPSYSDPDLAISALVQANLALPATIFVSKKGKLVAVHPGGYSSAAALRADINRYLQDVPA